MQRHSGGHRVLVNKNQIRNEVPPLVLPPTKASSLLDKAIEQTGTGMSVQDALSANLLSLDSVDTCPKCSGAMRDATLYGGEKVRYCNNCRVALPLPFTMNDVM